MDLDIDDELYERLSRRADEKGFESPEDYSITIIKTVLDELEKTDTDDQVQNRLEDLGYLE